MLLGSSIPVVAMYRLDDPSICVLLIVVLFPVSVQNRYLKNIKSCCFIYFSIFLYREFYKIARKIIKTNKEKEV